MFSDSEQKLNRAIDRVSGVHLLNMEKHDTVHRGNNGQSKPIRRYLKHVECMLRDGLYMTTFYDWWGQYQLYEWFGLV